MRRHNVPVSFQVGSCPLRLSTNRTALTPVDDMGQVDGELPVLLTTQDGVAEHGAPILDYLVLTLRLGLFF